MIETLRDALQEEFAGEVMFHPSIPSNLKAPSIVIQPGTPFITNSTHGNVEETWEVVVIQSSKQADRGVKALRDLSLRVREVCGEVGALWVSVSHAGSIGEEESLLVGAINQVKFRY